MGYQDIDLIKRLQELKGRVEEAPKPQDASLRVLPPEVTLAAAIADFMTS